MNIPTQELKQLRADVDVLIKMAQQLSGSRYASLGITGLEAGKMHIGNTLFEIGAAAIYKESMNPSNAVIDKYHVDEDITPISVPADWNQDGNIQNLKIMRRELNGILVRVKSLLTSNAFMAVVNPDEPYAYLFLSEAVVKFREAQNWFGMALGQIRDTQIAQ